MAACRSRLPNIFERYADVDLFGRGENFVPDFGQAEKNLDEALRYGAEFSTPEHHLVRIRHKRRIAGLLDALERRADGTLNGVSSVSGIVLDDSSLEAVLAHGLEKLCGDNADRQQAAESLRKVFLLENKSVDRKELGLRLVALEQLVRRCQLDRQALTRLQKRLVEISIEIVDIVNAELEPGESPVSVVPYLNYHMNQLEQAIQETEADTTE